MIVDIFVESRQLISIAVLPILLIILRYIYILIKYLRSSYGEISGNGIFQVFFNKGTYGEFSIFTVLEKVSRRAKVLTNLYLPKKNGETTEIDIVLIDETGIYVLESKNYGGYIFGDDKSKFWTQTLKGGHKHKFFNPIWQNQSHIGALKSLQAHLEETVYSSYIVFSNRCQLKSISSGEDAVVLQRRQLKRKIREAVQSRPVLLSNEEVYAIYTHLKQYTKGDKATKEQHMRNVSNRVRNYDI